MPFLVLSLLERLRGEWPICVRIGLTSGIDEVHGFKIRSIEFAKARDSRRTE